MSKGPKPERYLFARHYMTAYADLTGISADTDAFRIVWSDVRMYVYAPLIRELLRIFKVRFTTLAPSEEVFHVSRDELDTVYLDLSKEYPAICSGLQKEELYDQVYDSVKYLFGLYNPQWYVSSRLLHSNRQLCHVRVRRTCFV